MFIAVTDYQKKLKKVDDIYFFANSINKITGDPLPFGSLGKHKAAGFQAATPCLFVFDCLYYNGENLMNTPLRKRKELLSKVMVEVGNNVKFSEAKIITKKSDLSEMIKDVLSKGLEGLVLKDTKRHVFSLRQET